MVPWLAFHQSMRLRLPGAYPLAALSLLAACKPLGPPPQHAVGVASRQEPIPAPKLQQPDAQPPVAPKLIRRTISGIEFEGVAFDSRTHRLEVIDQPKGPGSAFATAADAAAKNRVLLAINAGFFTPEGKPLGLVVTQGKRYGAWKSSSSLGSGIFAESFSGQLSISRRSSPSATYGALELIQAGPLLIESGSKVGGLDSGKSALRSILVTDGGTRWWIGKTSSCSLAALGSALASGSPEGWAIGNAMNLDGGRSTDLFVSSAVPGGPINRRGFLNRPVRNFLVLKSR